MKRVHAACIVVLTGFLASPASAQIVIQQNLFQNPLALVENKDAQKDLKLVVDQLERLAELSEAYQAGVKGLNFQDIEKRKKVNEAARNGLADVLDGDQAKRLKQLEVQQRGANIFFDPQLVKELTITQQQQTALLKAMQAVGPKSMAAIQNAKGNQQEIRKAISDINRNLTADIVKGLTPDQQAKWRDLTGAPFDGSFPMAMVPFGIVPNRRPQPVLTWHMNDLAAAQAEAKKTGKPIFVTFRCEA